MMSIRNVAVGVVLALWCAGCGGGSSPTAPTVASPAPTSPRILLAGNSNAFFLAPYLPEALDMSLIDASIDYWLANGDFAERARTTPLVAFVWAQSADPRVSVDEYMQKFRQLVTIARVTRADLPVRIIELPDMDRVNRAVLREAQRRLANDPGVQLIPTADLELDSTGNHFTMQGYQAIRDRIYRSIGR